ncbi:MAG: UDP-N-acetylglucosamine 2-epimerase (non-hydrolyzing) [Deltaproteobacteria bacterium]|nr:MAG: UDP-N-acetylglucosamine 2-epimerase (non-hydrolyzing) [Deltaproteobacteria bacterium]
MKVLTVFGTRPEAIKMAPLVKALDADDRFDSRVCVTAQHRGMLDQVLAQFAIEPHHDLGIMKPGQDLYDVTSRVLLGMRDVLKAEAPDAVLVHGDTTTTLAGTLAAFYAQIPVGHVEAGLRTGNLMSPWPEEANRVLADRICHWHFAPTQRSANALLAEGCDPARVVVTGNTVIDALLWMRDRLPSLPATEVDEPLAPVADLLASDARIVLVTGHRRESFGGGFLRICQALATLAERFPDVQFIYPVHLNPNVQKPVNEHLSGVANIRLVDPLGYAPFVRLMDRADIILTDSGGIQEEAPALGKPVLVMRDTTERPEGVEAGTVKLVGTVVEAIVGETTRLLTDPTAYAAMADAHNPYGDGHASQRILDALAKG